MEASQRRMPTSCARAFGKVHLREVEQKTLVQIGDELGISERSVRRLLAMKEPPQERIHRERKISLVEHEETIQKIINEYGENTSKIYVKLTEYGVKTSLRSVQRWMQENREIILNNFYWIFKEVHFIQNIKMI